MVSVFQNISFLVEQVGFGVFLVYLYGVFARKDLDTSHIDISLGILFGIAAILAMADPIKLHGGIIIDLRNLYVGLAAAFFGWRGGLACASLAVATRLGIGGAGTTAGVASILVAMVMGLIWAYHVRPRVTKVYIGFQLLALMISCHIFAGTFLPDAIQARYYTELAPLMFLGNVIGVNLVGPMIVRETALVGENRQLIKAATTDPLTMVLNRRSAIARYRRICNKPPPKRGIAMTCIDLDKFKTINDTYGHLAGDRVLKEVAHRLTTCLRPSDVFCRMSGDEFLFVLVDVTSQEARQITERCRSLISRVPVTYEDDSIDVTISLGTAWSPRPLSFDAFRNKADDALYFAKDKGRNRAGFDVETIGKGPSQTQTVA